MTLTPEDVERQTFSTALRGYDLNEVDDFLDQVVLTLKDLNAKIDAGDGAPIPAETTEPIVPVAAPAPAPPPAPTPPPDESAVGRVLITAQETADRIVEDARAESERILEEARSEADELVTQRDEHRAMAEAEMASLTQRVGDVRTKLAVLATEVSRKLDEMDVSIESTLQSDDVEDGAEDDSGADVFDLDQMNAEGSEEDDEETGEDADEEVSDEKAGDEPDDDFDDNGMSESVASAIAGLSATDDDSDEE